MKKERGRPRTYDEDTALEAAMNLFWQKGLTATSLDDLSAAMKMNRPSLYNAFGNKEAIYRRAMARFVRLIGEQLGGILSTEADLKKALMLFYEKAIDIYATPGGSLGCFVTCTTPVEVMNHEALKKDLLAVINEVDSVLKQRLQIAQQEGQWPADADAELSAKLLHATLQSLALRVRAGEPKKDLTCLYTHAVNVLCPA